MMTITKFSFYRTMVSFPPEMWDVRDIKGFDDITVPAPTGSKLHLQALLVGKPANGKEGQFRLLVSGNDNLTFRVRVRDVLDSPLFDNMHVECQLLSGSQVKHTVNNKTNKIINCQLYSR